MTPEAKVRNKVVKWARAHGVEHVRMAFRPGVKVGVPDDLFLLPNGWAQWIEFKAPGKSPTPRQHDKIKNIRRLKHDAMWTDDANEAIAALERMMMWKER